jgi:hypothetical protein
MRTLALSECQIQSKSEFMAHLGSARYRFDSPLSILLGRREDELGHL